MIKQAHLSLHFFRISDNTHVAIPTQSILGYDEEIIAYIHQHLDLLKNVKEIELFVTFYWEGQCNLEFLPSTLQELAARSITLCVTAEEHTVLTAKPFHHIRMSVLESLRDKRNPLYQKVRQIGLGPDIAISDTGIVTLRSQTDNTLLETDLIVQYPRVDFTRRKSQISFLSFRAPKDKKINTPVDDIHGSEREILHFIENYREQLLALDTYVRVPEPDVAIALYVTFYEEDSFNLVLTANTLTLLSTYFINLCISG